MSKIITYINSKDIGGNPVRHELHQGENWKGEPYYHLVDAYYQNGKRLCENLRGFQSYDTIADGLDALEYVAGKKFTPEFRAMICNQNTQINKLETV